MVGDAETCIERRETEMHRVRPATYAIPATGTRRQRSVLSATLSGQDLLPAWAPRTLAHWLAGVPVCSSKLTTLSNCGWSNCGGISRTFVHHLAT